ncbi:MAG: type IV pilus assembly protein PilM [bacterium]|nr:type IV pilus assembly protein PilM [bacterium]
MKTSLGLDIGSKSIKLIELGKDKGKIQLLAAGSTPTPQKSPGTTGTQEDTASYASSIKKLIRDAGVRSRSVFLALPESQVFTRVIQMPALSERELASALRWEAEQYIPLPLTQVNMDFSVLRDAKETGTNTMDILLVASPKSLLEKYLGYVELAGLNALGVETEIIAISRALTASSKNVKTVMLFSFGAQTSDLAILRGGTIAFTRSISAGGDALTRALSQGLGLELVQAEEFKKTYGLEEQMLEGKILQAAKPIMEAISGEIRRSILYFEEKAPGEHVSIILLTGGSARMPGLVVYLAQNLGNGIEIQVADPWIGIERDQRFAVLDHQGPVFSTSVGLALRSL